MRREKKESGGGDGDAAPLRPSKRVGRAIKEEGQGRAGVLPSGSCLPPGTSRTRELLLLFLARAVTYGYECTVRGYGVTTAISTAGTYARTCVRACVCIRERARYNSERTTWLMPLVGLRSALNPLSHARILDIFLAVWRGAKRKRNIGPEEKEVYARERRVEGGGEQEKMVRRPRSRLVKDS